MLRIFIIAVAAIAISSLAGGKEAFAADIPVVRTVRPAAVYVSHRRAVFRHHSAVKLVGMPCVLRPHIVVGLNWNGPQCRYVDNLIIPHARFVDAFY